MVGKCSRIHGLLLASAQLIATGSCLAQAETVRGQSRELGIRFEVDGGQDWCRPEISVTLSAAKREAFQPEALQFVQMLGRIRAVVLDQCPSLERIVFVGAANKQAVMAVEMSRLTRWARVIEVDPATREPACPDDARLGSDCGKRVEAYSLAKRLMRGGEFAEVEVTTLLEPGDAAHLAWKAPDLVGKLTIRDRGDFSGQLRSSDGLADAVIRELTKACRSEGGLADRSWGENWPDAASTGPIAARGVSCANSVPHHHAVIVASTPARFHIFALRSEGEAPDPVQVAAKAMAQAMSAGR